MDKVEILFNEFEKHGGILKTSEISALGFSSRQVKRLVDDGVILRIKRGYYQLASSMAPEEAMIARLFPKSVLFLESALLHYQYTDRIPSAWQIAVDRDSEKTQYKLDYPLIEPYYQEPKLLEIGQDTIDMAGVPVRIFNRDRAICDVLRYENKLEREVFTNAIQRYVQDSKKNVNKLLEYAKILNIHRKVETYVGVWL